MPLIRFLSGNFLRSRKGEFMTKSPRDVTEAELAVLRVLWDRGQSSVREITETVYGSGDVSDYSTVKKLLLRLEKKYFVTRSREKVPHRFEAATSRDDLLSRRLKTLADDLCDGSQTPLLMNLLQGEEVSDEQRQTLRDLIEGISEGATHKKSRKSKKEDGRSQ